MYLGIKALRGEDVYFRCNNGGRNKTHEQVEQTPRIDSFELAFTGSWGGIYCGQKYLNIYQDEEHCEIFPPDGYTIQLSHKNNGFGGKQTFFLCPGCGQRVRYLYVTGQRDFLCRKCAKLNYKSQQQTKDSMMDYWKGMEYAKKHLSLPPWPVDGFAFLRYLPDRPRGMHENTYRRHLLRFFRYQLRHGKRLVEDLGRILG